MIEVWAPDAQSVDLDACADGRDLREPLTRRRGGWWRWEGDPDAYDVLDYGFVVDGVIVNGSARVVDLAATLLRRTQSGYLYHYAFAMIIGLIALLAVLMRVWR